MQLGPRICKMGRVLPAALGNGLLYPSVSCSTRGSGPGRVMGFADLDEGIVGVLVLFFGLV